PPAPRPPRAAGGRTRRPAPCRRGDNVRASRKTAATLAPGKRKMTLRDTESRAEPGRPVSRLTTVKPSRNFPRLRPQTASRSRMQAAPIARNAIDAEDQYNAKIEATSRPSIVAAYSRRRDSAFAYGDARLNESFANVGYTSAKETPSPANPTTVCIFMCSMRLS